MKKSLLTLLITLATGFCHNVSAQQAKEKITQALASYFSLERENIHAHIDKNTFMTTEKIWFKGYVYHRKKGKPFFPSTNIFCYLMDSDGKVIETQLLYGSAGTFSGSFGLSGLKTGKYYLQFYTNWMNNFIEDESAVYEVIVINQQEGDRNMLKGMPSEISITLLPEGGNFINGIHNNVGIQVSGCNQKPVNVTEASLLDGSGKEMKKIQINGKGYGKFDIIANQAYKIAIKYNGKDYEQALPVPSSTGIAVNVNNYTNSNTILSLSTNQATLDALGNKPLQIVIHQDEKLVLYETAFNGKTELVLPVASSELFPGINTIRILDSGLNQLAERIIYNHTDNTTSVIVEKDRIDFEYDRDYKVKLKPNMNASIAVLPANTHAIDASYDLYGDLLISPYLENNAKIPGRYYLEQATRAKKYELDLALLNHKSKYSWHNILHSPPKADYSFDIGLSLKCKINQNLSPKKDYRVKITAAAAMLEEYIDLKGSDEFTLDNLIVADSTKLRFTLFENRVKQENVKLAPTITNNIRKFNKPFSPPGTCPMAFLPSIAAEDTITLLPNYRIKTVLLDEVAIEVKGKKLRYEKGMGNSQLRGYKISDTDSRNFFYILDLIRYHGFDVVNDGVHVGIYGRTVNTINGQRTTPMVWVDNMPIMSFDQLLNIQTSDVDELYIHPHVPAPSVANKMGWIKIYMKKDFSHWDKKQPQVASFQIQNGFKKIWPFSNADYASYTDKGFENFGIFDWQPLATADENGNYMLTIPYTGEGPVKLFVEGMNPDGSIYSGIHIINQ